MFADRAKLGCSLRLDEAEDAAQNSANVEVRICSVMESMRFEFLQAG